MITRRDALKAGATTIVLGGLVPGQTSAAKRIKREAVLRSGTFPTGVMSGQPDLRSATLWTRVGEIERSGRVILEVSREEGFGTVLHRQEVRAAAIRDFTARTRLKDVKGLQPGERYFYRFRTRTTESPIGRFTTARPADSMEPLRIAFFSCQVWGKGFYTAHRGIADEPDVDLTISLGDYIYETNTSGPVRADRSSAAESGQAELLEDYRRKYRLYKADPDLMAMHASAAFVATWDDHEVENNRAGRNPGTTSRRRIGFEQRERNAYTAWFENFPVEKVPGDPTRVYRTVRLGGLADVLLLDLRQYRDAIVGREAVPHPDDTRAGKTMLGAAQKAWLKQELRDGRAPWRIIGSSVEMFAWDGAPGARLNPDQWDGYAAERAEILDHAAGLGLKDLAVMTGDVHHFVASQLTTTGRLGGTPVGAEYVGGAITNDLGELNAAKDVLPVNAVTNPHWRYANFARNGYGLMTITPDELRVDFRSPTTVEAKTARMETLASFVQPRGAADCRRV